MLTTDPLLSSADDIAALTAEKHSAVYGLLYWILIGLAKFSRPLPSQDRVLENDIYVLF
jgi:hypothetical protein